MTEPSKSEATPAAAGGTGHSAVRNGKRTGLSRVLAWIGIVAGAVFVVAVVFFSGFLLNWSSSDHGSGHHMGPTSMSCCDQIKPGHPM